MANQELKRVFISYSHDSDEHRAFVRGVADRLRNEGIDCLIDQYINGFPPEGWQRWMADQIEAADYVLLVCTETYLRRFKGKETDGGKGVNFEGVVISQHLYDAYYQNSKFIPVIPAQGDYDHVPVPLKPYSTYRFPDQYDDVYRILTDQAQYVPPVLGDVRKLGRTIKIDRLPTVAGAFFGREVELKLLDDALEKSPLSPLFQKGVPSSKGGDVSGESPRIIQFIASGGTGKTKLLRHWLNQRQDAICNYIVWSFYSQGTSESKQVFATPLITEAFKQFGLTYEDYATDEDRADELAQQLAQHKCLLVLDGLEPLQYGGKGFDGQLKDRAMKRLLQQLAQQPDCLCIITTRIHVHDLKDREHVVSHPLDNLKTADGVQLLRSLAVHGADKELQTAVTEVEGHALTLHLLGNALTTYLDGDIRKRDTLEELVDDFDEQGRHAFKVMQGYEHWLTDDNGRPAVELRLLYLLGLFDHPIEISVLKALFREEDFSELNKRIQIQLAYKTRGLGWFKRIIVRFRLAQEMITARNIYDEFIAPIKKLDEKQFYYALMQLKDKHRLLSQYGECLDLLDCHPLIREYFGRQLRQQQPEAWQQAHEALYHYYKALPEKEQPDTLEEMQPLFHAVVHGCAAGLHQQALYEVYWARINQETMNFLSAYLGGFCQEVIVLSRFFNRCWSVPAPCLDKYDLANLFNWTGHALRASGRLYEALELIGSSVNVLMKAERWGAVSAELSNLSGLNLSLGDVETAVKNGELSVIYADKSHDPEHRMSKRATYAEALLQRGNTNDALEVFEEAEKLCQQYGFESSNLCGLLGFKYCDLLVSDVRARDVIKLCDVEYDYLIENSMNYVLLGRANHLLGNLIVASDMYEAAVTVLRESGYKDRLPFGLLARAALWRDLKEWGKAHRDLAEVCEIAEPSGMRLHLTDYHLEMARLLLAENPPCSPFFKGVDAPDSTGSDRRALPFEKGETEGISYHIAEAAKLIEETGYHRRDKELADLQAQVNGAKSA